LHASGQHWWAASAATLGVSRATIYRSLGSRGDAQQPAEPQVSALTHTVGGQ
jgi:hypothetical protein